MSTLMQASQQWATRPSDERYTNLNDMQAHFNTIREQSRGYVLPSRKVQVEPVEGDNKALVIVGGEGQNYAPTHWAFGQLAQRAEAPAGYLRTLPSPIVADCINYGLQYKRDIEDLGVLVQRNGSNIVRAVTGPNYGRIWNNEVVTGLVDRFGNGIDGRFRVPGEFGKAVDVTKANTTLFAGDQDMFVFLADEANRIEVPDRRNGQSGSLARGFFVWNSEVGSRTFGVSTFLFDYACCNRIVWGARDYKQITIRHTASAPVKWAEEMAPALEAYANSSTASVVEAITAAKAKRIDSVDDFLAKRFGTRMAPLLQAIHLAEEGRPVETLWDAATAVTAQARSIQWQDTRVALETKAGELLDLAA